MKKINYLLIAILLTAACKKQIEVPKETGFVIGWNDTDPANYGFVGYESVDCDWTIPHLAKEDILFSIDGGGGDNGRMGAFCLKDRTIEDWFKGTQTKVHYSVMPEDSALEGWSFGHYEIYNRDGLHPVGFGKNILDDYALKEITQMNPPVDWSHAQMHNIIRLKCGE